MFSKRYSLCFYRDLLASGTVTPVSLSPVMRKEISPHLSDLVGAKSAKSANDDICGLPD